MVYLFTSGSPEMSRLMTKPTKRHVRPAKTQISLGIRPVWSASSLSAWRKLRSFATHWAQSEDSDQTGRMPRLIWVFAGRTVILLVLSCCGSYYVCQINWTERSCRLFGPRQANLVLIAYASSEGSGEPAHPRSLARTFAARSYKHWIKRNFQTENQIPGPSEWLGMRSWNWSWRNARRHKFAWRGSLSTIDKNAFCGTLIWECPRKRCNVKLNYKNALEPIQAFWHNIEKSK